METVKHDTSAQSKESDEYPEEVRFEMDANDYNTVLKYFRNRAIQLLASGEGMIIRKKPEMIEDWGVHAVFTEVKDGKETEYHSLYVLKDHRGKGHFPRWYAQNTDKIIFTVGDCDLEEFLKSKGVAHKVAQKPTWSEYKMIEDFYGNKIARRSRVHLMNHIDEGLYILNLFGASEYAKRMLTPHISSNTVEGAYAIHPLLQADADLKNFWDNPVWMENIDRRVLLLAAEYRNIANGYLSQMPSTDSPKLSPIQEVNTMLIADKIQNRKDFELYHLGTHPRSDRLQQYFSQWLTALDVTEERYQQVKKDILSKTSLPSS